MNEDTNKNSIEFLRSLYLDILNGSSFSEEYSIFVKHLNDLESNQVVRKRLYLLEKYKKEGIPTFDEKLKEIIKNDIWNFKKEDDILSLKYQISDNEKHLKTIVSQQRPVIQYLIDQKKKDLSQLLFERKQHIGKTANDFALKDSENYFIFLCLYKDSELKEKIFKTYEDFDLLEENEIDNYSKIIEEKLLCFKEEYIQKIAVMPFFLNNLSYCKDSIFNFYNKSISQLSPYQVYIFSLGNRNLNILNQAENGAIPPEIGLDVSIEKIIEWYDTQYSIIKGKNSQTSIGITTRSVDVVTKRY